ncbi:MAG: hypothetical protein NUV45_05215 [Tepidanaerobacteraceae bacterium]|nr:hypothetical protein [Tepidanaerobacteraceae bacterium]
MPETVFCIRLKKHVKKPAVEAAGGDYSSWLQSFRQLWSISNPARLMLSYASKKPFSEAEKGLRSHETLRAQS